MKKLILPFILGFMIVFACACRTENKGGSNLSSGESKIEESKIEDSKIDESKTEESKDGTAECDSTNEISSEESLDYIKGRPLTEEEIQEQKKQEPSNYGYQDDSLEVPGIHEESK